jgi:N-methylhydantoinase B
VLRDGASGAQDGRALPGKFTTTIRRGEVFSHEQPGPGGWGDPLEREPARVLRDVLNELVSVAAAREHYGVVVVEDEPAPGGRRGRSARLGLDRVATEVLRGELRARRAWATPPVVSR